MWFTCVSQPRLPVKDEPMYAAEMHDELVAELLSEFVAEARLYLSDVDEELLALKEQGCAIDVVLVDAIFRSLHSIEGVAGFLGLYVLQGLALLQKEVLNRLRNHELLCTPTVIETLIQSSNCIGRLLDSVELSNDHDISEHHEALESILKS